MPTEFMAPLIALAGVLISAIVSYITSRRSIDNELRRLRMEAEKTYEGRILEARISTYPQLYFLVSDFAKKIKRSGITKDVLESFITALEEWDSKNAIFMSLHSASTCYEFRSYLREVLRNTANQQAAQATTEFLDRIGIFEFALKSDLGIWGIEGGRIHEVKTLKSHDDYIRELERLKTGKGTS